MSHKEDPKALADARNMLQYGDPIHHGPALRDLIAWAEAQQAAPPAALAVPGEVALAYGYLWHAMEPGDFPAGGCVAVPPSEAAEMARGELRKLLPMAERKEAITRARAALAERAQGLES